MRCTAELINDSDKRLMVENAEFHQEALGIRSGADGSTSGVRSAATVTIPSDLIETIKGFKPVHIIIKITVAQPVRWDVSYSWPGPLGEFRLVR